MSKETLDNADTATVSLPRLRFNKGERKKRAPKLNMNIPLESKPPVLNIFSSASMTTHLSNYNRTNKEEIPSQTNGSTNGETYDAPNGLPSAATTLTVASFTTLNDDTYPQETGLLSAFSSNLKISEKEDENELDQISTPTKENCLLEGIDKPIDQLTELDWKILHEKNLIQTIEVLGEGNGGSVKKCKTLTKNPAIFALKIITTDPSPEFQKQMVRELNYNRKFSSAYIVKYYGTFLDESSSSIYICMEYMGGRSLDALYKSFKERDGRLSEKPLGKIASSVLKGLAYLNEHKVMHRDIKPQNILLDTLGNVKLCDFGVSGDVVNSLATTFTGTSFYMAPERIKNEPYTISCDVWSLGLTVLEGALGEFPFVRESSPDLQISPLDLLLIIIEFEPTLEDDQEEGIKWSKGFKDFIKVCLTKDGRVRPSPRQMLDHPWLLKMETKLVRMDKLVKLCWHL
ncbi:hypothetical protein CANINC_003374 [Pichia inconspicua]|uniref:mitogen-activated protein kinase kinase n=1 Tax=Pichia inconspicua TaxID=52247 RepID=A0A4T0WYR4_9ASCO|nr:hypothetical protein CANINC_003374 [[Candida] inconspicua]